MKALGKSKKGAVSKRGSGATRDTNTARKIDFSALLRWFDASKETLALVPWKGVFKLSVFMVVLTGLWFGQQFVWKHLDQSITRIDLKGDFIFLDQNSIRPVLSRALGKGFFSVDIDNYRKVIEEQPWIAKAAIKRVWPATLEVSVEEEVPVAKWNQHAMLNPYGKVFTPENIGQEHAHLPRLTGPKGQQIEVLKQYAKLHDLLKSSDITVLALALEPRGAWQLTVDEELPVMLGRTHIEERLQRFVKVYIKHLKNNRDKVKLVDARYTNGVSIAWNFKPSEKKES